MSVENFHNLLKQEHADLSNQANLDVDNYDEVMRSISILHSVMLQLNKVKTLLQPVEEVEPKDKKKFKKKSLEIKIYLKIIF